jgi:hypothetical protein
MSKCICEKDERAMSLYRFRETGDAIMGSHDWSMLQAGFAKYNAVPKWERRDWLRSDEYGAKHVRAWFDLLAHVEMVEESCPAFLHYPTPLMDEWYGSDVETSQDDGRVLDDALEYEYRQFVLHREHHGLPWHDGYDDESPYLRNEGHVLSKAAWDREYALPTTVTEKAIETVPDSNPIYAAAGFVEDVEVERERTVMGAVHWEYRRRAQGREPWMHPATYKWCRDLERARAKKQLQRSKIAQLIRALGGDPRKPEVASWVTERGYEAALASLEARAEREGVLV